MDEFRYKEGYKRHLNSLQKKKAYHFRQKNKIKRLGRYMDNRNGEYHTPPPAPMCEESYALCGNSKRYYQVWYVQSDIIKTKKDHGLETLQRGSYRRNRQMSRQLTRTRLNRMEDIQMTRKIWRNL